MAMSLLFGSIHFPNGSDWGSRRRLRSHTAIPTMGYLAGSVHPFHHSSAGRDASMRRFHRFSTRNEFARVGNLHCDLERKTRLQSKLIQRSHSPFQSPSPSGWKRLRPAGHCDKIVRPGTSIGASASCRRQGRRRSLQRSGSRRANRGKRCLGENWNVGGASKTFSLQSNLSFRR